MNFENFKNLYIEASINKKFSIFSKFDVKQE